MTQYPVNEQINQHNVEFFKIPTDDLLRAFRKIQIAAMKSNVGNSENDMDAMAIMIDVLEEKGYYDSIRKTFYEHMNIVGVGNVFEKREIIFSSDLMLDTIMFFKAVEVYLGESLQGAGEHPNTSQK